MSSGGSYDPHAVEKDIYRFWEAGRHFHAVADPDRRPYTIVIPPPNVTGALHMGHALDNTLQDVLIRHKRMCGFATLWMPGTDHAGIATQAVVEKRLREEQGLTRHEIGREGLVKKIWEWKEEYNSRILTQLRAMGCSCDWSRTRFTLDEVCAQAVYETFFRFFRDGLIFRGTRLVNWDAALQTAVADDEIVHETVKGHLWHIRYPLKEGIKGSRDRGIEGEGEAPAEPKAGADFLVVATTRPETMLGDTAVAVHPDDPRYKHLIGQRCTLPLMERPIPIIGDPILVSQEFGTGCVKVTPGHDPNDYECGKRHGLEMINILTPDGKINANGGAYAGLDRYEARKKVVADLEARGLIERVEPYQHEVGHSDRSKTPIEPLLSEQWFVKMDKLAETAMEAVRDGRVRFFPERYAKTFLDWLGEKRDWCISRQLWWGHRIPVWSREYDLDVPEDYEELRSLWDYADTVQLLDEAEELAAFVWDLSTGARLYGPGQSASRFLTWLDDPMLRGVKCRVHVCYVGRNSHVLSAIEAVCRMERDHDVLDTWFSSALWPHSTLGWPDDYGKGNGTDEAPASSGTCEAGASQYRVPASATGGRRYSADATGGTPVPPTDLDYFYPTDVLCTAREIITLWVARMVITGLYNVGRVPFQHVYIHPVVQDGWGRRMSKSLGNGVDPLDLIYQFGADAMRFTLTQLAGETQDIRMPVKAVKLANGRTVNTSERFETGRNFCNKLWQAATGFVLPNLEGVEVRPLRRDDLAIEDRWILSRLAACVADMDRRLARYQFNEVANTLYAFFWNDFCDWYVELVKPRLYAEGTKGSRDQGIEGSREQGSEGSKDRGITGSKDQGAERDEAVPTFPRFHLATGESGYVARQVLAFVLDQTLRLLHPIIPFITEALWQKLNAAAPRRGITVIYDGEPALIAAAWPSVADKDTGETPVPPTWRDLAIEREMEALQNVIRALRDTLARINTGRSAAREPAIGKLPRAIIKADAAIVAELREQHAVLERLGRCEALEIGSDVAKPAESATRVLPDVEVYVPLGGLMDLAAERQRLGKERDELHAHIERLSGKLANEGFIAKAPAAVVEQERGRLAEMQERLATIERNLADLA